MVEILPYINKKYILDRLSQEEIMSHYLGIDIELSKLVCSPLRKDANPTCGFKYINGILYFRDFGGDFRGDCFNVVQHKYKLKNFGEVVNKIASDYNLVSISQQYEARDIEDSITIDNKKTIEYSIGINQQKFTEVDKKYWGSYYLEEDFLNKAYTYSCRRVFMNGNIVYNYNKYDPAYAYYFGNDKWKIYFPFRDKKLGRFRSNCSSNILQGYNLLPEKSINSLTITKSYKDVLVFRLLSKYAVAPQAESNIISSNIISDLYTRADNIVSLYDFDLTGVKAANRLRKNDGIYPLFLTNGRFNTYNYESKDISDFIRKFGVQDTIDLINSFHL